MVVALAGCGSSSGGRLSKAQFAKNADAICTTYRHKVANAFAGTNSANSDELAAAIGKAIPLIRRGNDELAALKPPKELAGTYHRWVAKARTEESQAADLRDAVKQQAIARVRGILVELRRLEAEQNQVARRDLGLKSCAQG